MSRPAEYEDNTTTCITLPRELLRNCKNLGVPISEICRKALYLETKSPRAKELQKIRDRFKDVPVRYLKKMSYYVGVEPKRAKIWADVINKKCGMRVTAKDVLDYVNRKK